MKTVILVSGKRCVGKDAFCNLLQTKLETKSILVEKFAAADECKRLFAQQENLDVERLKNDRDYKEQHRAALTKFFWKHKLAVFEGLVADSIANSTATVCIVTDFRFASQLGHITLLPKISSLAIRICCSDDKRQERGWTFDEKKDNDATETSLDSFEFFDKLVDNDGTLQDLEHIVDQLIKEFNL